MSNSQEYQLVKIARLYYQEEYNFRQIADKLNISVATVSRILARAKREGVVEITIHDSLASFRDIEVTLEQRFGLKECIVVPSGESRDAVYQHMGRAVGDIFTRLFRSPAVLGVSWGETLNSIGEHLPMIKAENVKVIPIIGAMGMIETGVYPNMIAKVFAQRLGGVNYLVNYPALLDSSSLRSSVDQESSMKQIRNLWREVDTALLSVSGLDDASSVSKYAVFSPDELKELSSAGIVCATNFNMLGRDGNEISHPVSCRIINLDLEGLRNVKHVIVAAAGKEKIQALCAVLRGKIPTILVVDEETAAGVMAET